MSLIHLTPITISINEKKKSPKITETQWYNSKMKFMKEKIKPDRESHNKRSLSFEEDIRLLWFNY